MKSEYAKDAVKGSWAKRGLSAVLAGALACSMAAPCFALATEAAGGGTARATATKTQVVYVRDTAQGTQSGVYVVNSFDATQGGSYTDAGSYGEVSNLTDTQPLESANPSFTVTEGERFSYQGTLDTATETPWTVRASYFLNGTSVDASQLSGASGQLEMRLEVSPNGACERDYAQGYLLQTTAQLDNSLARDIVAENVSSMAQSGGNTQISCMLFPGESATYVIKAQVKDFEFSGWQLVGVPLSLALNIDESQFSSATTDMRTLSNAITALNWGAISLEEATKALASGAGQLQGGAQDLSAGTTALSAAAAQAAEGAATVSGGASQINAGAGSLNNGAAEVASGASSMNDATSTLSAGASALDGGAAALSAAIADQLVPGAETLAAGSSQYATGVAQQAASARNAAGGQGSADASAAFQEALQTYVGAYTTALLGYVAQNPSAAASEAVAYAQQAAAAQLQAVQAAAGALGYASAADALDGAGEQYAQLNTGIQALVDPESATSVYALQSAAGQLAAGSSNLASGASELSSGAAALSSGAGSVAAGASNLATGTESLASGASALATGTGKLAEGAGPAAAGASALLSGATSLASGAQQLTLGSASLQSGSSSLVAETTGLDQKLVDTLRDKLNEYLNPNYQVADFVNGTSDGLTQVQFVYKIDGVAAAESAPAEPATEDEPQGFFDKLAALFTALFR